MQCDGDSFGSGTVGQGRVGTAGSFALSAAGLVVLGYFSAVLKFHCKFPLNLKLRVFVLKGSHLLDNSKSILFVIPILPVNIVFCILEEAWWKAVSVGLRVR